MPKRPQPSKLTQGKRDRVSTRASRGCHAHCVPSATLPVFVICLRVMFTSPPSARVDYRNSTAGRACHLPFLLFDHLFASLWNYGFLFYSVRDHNHHYLFCRSSFGHWELLCFSDKPPSPTFTFFGTVLLSSSTRYPCHNLGFNHFSGRSWLPFLVNCVWAARAGCHCRRTRPAPGTLDANSHIHIPYTG